MEPFDLLGPLPAPRTTTVLEASAGTGKTFTLAGLVTRYLAEGAATLDQMLLITFGRAASQELRERVRAQILDALLALGDPSRAADNALLAHLVSGTPEEVAVRRERLRDALAGFDAATIATTHQFCQLVLRSLGVAGDTDSGMQLVESLEDVVTDIVDDLYLAHFGQERDEPLLSYEAALRLAREVVGGAHTELRPLDPAPGTDPAVRVEFATAVCAELEKRKRRLGILHYDDLLSRLADALEADDSPARARMRRRWSIVMVDEFQDTDPVQWQVIDRAFTGHSTVILIGDPKQAIYAFRGGDIVTYLHAARTAGHQRTLGTNYRSDGPLVASLQAVMRDAAARRPAHRGAPGGRRASGAPPGRVHRTTHRSGCGWSPATSSGSVRTRPSRSTGCAATSPRDLAADIGALLAGGATYDGRPLRPGDIAVIVESHRDGRACFEALTAADIPAVYTGDSDVFASRRRRRLAVPARGLRPAAPLRAGARRGHHDVLRGDGATRLSRSGDRLTDRITETLRGWADHARERGVAAVFEAAQRAGMGRAGAVLARRRAAHDRPGAPDPAAAGDRAPRALRPAGAAGLAAHAARGARRCDRAQPPPRQRRGRRADHDRVGQQGAAVPGGVSAVRVQPQHPDRDVVLFHDEDATRCLHIGGEESPDYDDVERRGRREAAGDDVRLTYVALTRAQSQVVAWWAPSGTNPTAACRGCCVAAGPVSRPCPIAATRPGSTTPTRWRCCGRGQDAGGPVLEESVIAAPTHVETPPVETISTCATSTAASTPSWRRTSYSGSDPRRRGGTGGVQRAGGRRARRRGRRCLGGTDRRRWPAQPSARR